MASTALPADAVRAAVEARLGTIEAFEPLPEGLDSQVFGFRKGTQALVARVNARSAGFLQDRLAAGVFASARLPIPEVLLVDDIGGAWLCITRRAAGKRVNDFGDADAPALVSALTAVLSAMAETSPPGGGFGPLDADCQAPFPTWRGYLLGADHPSLRTVAASRPALVEIERLAPEREPERRLIHGDFGGANVIADGRRITGVIDWDLAMAGDALYDEANLHFWREARLLPLTAALRHRAIGDPEWPRTMACYGLRICLAELAGALAGVNPVDPAWLAARLDELLAEAKAL